MKQKTAKKKHNIVYYVGGDILYSHNVLFSFLLPFSQQKLLLLWVTFPLLLSFRLPSKTQALTQELKLPDWLVCDCKKEKVFIRRSSFSDSVSFTSEGPFFHFYHLADRITEWVTADHQTKLDIVRLTTSVRHDDYLVQLSSCFK